MLENNFFVCKGKLSGCYDRRSTPGGVLLEEIVIAVPTKVPWKENKIMHIRITCWGETVENLKKFKTGDAVSVEGFIEQTGKGNEKEFKLIATQIEKEK
ncbi:MAG: single-stranded DNA-binding protein [bacterium]